jgi:hypothetical protein
MKNYQIKTAIIIVVAAIIIGATAFIYLMISSLFPRVNAAHNYSLVLPPGWAVVRGANPGIIEQAGQETRNQLIRLEKELAKATKNKTPGAPPFTLPISDNMVAIRGEDVYITISTVNNADGFFKEYNIAELKRYRKERVGYSPAYGSGGSSFEELTIDGLPALKEDRGYSIDYYILDKKQRYSIQCMSNEPEARERMSEVIENTFKIAGD